MLGGLRLLTFFLILLIGVVALVYAEDSPAKDSSAPSGLAGPPKAKVAPVEDTVQGHKIVDRYAELIRQRSQQAEVREHCLFPGIHQHEATGAVRILRLSRLETGLANQSGLRILHALAK